MTFRRWSGLARLLLSATALASAVALTGAVALAQVSGEIMVGRAANSLAPGLPAPEERSPDTRLANGLASELAEPEPIVLPQPVYPRAARAARQEGRVVVCFTLDERGRVHTPVVRASTDAVFNEPVLDAIGASRFTPARVGKQAVRSTACRTFQFVLR